MHATLNGPQTEAFYVLVRSGVARSEEGLRIEELDHWRRNITLGEITFTMNAKGWIVPPNTDDTPDESAGIEELDTRR